MENLITKEEMIKTLDDYAKKIGEIDLSQLPAIIDAQIELVEELSIKIDAALKAAEDAKDSADVADAAPVGLFRKKKAIAGLQASGIKAAEAIGETVGALKLSFEYEKQLGEISKCLLAIAACSAAHTESAIKRINDAIQNRTANKPLNEGAKERLQEIVNQMKAQGEIIKRMEEKEALDKAQDKKIDEQDKKNDEQDKKIDEMAADDDRQDALIEDLKHKIHNLEKWRIITLIISGCAFVLTLLQILGVL